MDKIKAQSSKVGELIFAAETGAAYQKVLLLTWDILRETGVLLWLIICLVFVGAEWFWQTSIQLGGQARNWYEGLKEPTNEEPKSAGEIGQSIADTLGSGAANLLYQAKQQLGMDATPPAPKPEAPTPPPKATTPQPTPVSAPPKTPPATPSAPTTTIIEPPSTPAAESDSEE
ncbi:MAG: hypothetical protein AAFX78_00495 [Cyanobacteria bacterium J06638_20]